MYYELVSFIFYLQLRILIYIYVQVETDEMRPQWFAEDEVPFALMWPDDPLWFPYFLGGKRFDGTFTYSDDNTITDYNIREL